MSHNAIEAITAAPGARPGGAPVGPVKHGSYGQVPAYLAERKAEWSAEAAARDAAAAAGARRPGGGGYPPLSRLRGAVQARCRRAWC